MSDSTADVIVKLRDLMAKATPGPWTARKSVLGQSENLQIAVPTTIVRQWRDEQGRRCTSYLAELTHATDNNNANAEFICALVNALPALLAVGERHEAAELAQDIADAVRTESVSDITTQHLRPYEEYRQERLASEAGIARTREALTDAAKTVLRGFDEGVFVRSTDGDADPAWAVKLLPFIGALATLQREVAALTAAPRDAGGEAPGGHTR